MCGKSQNKEEWERVQKNWSGRLIAVPAGTDRYRQKQKKPRKNEALEEIYVAPQDGLEPPTRWLTVTCSTNWATEE